MKSRIFFSIWSDVYGYFVDEYEGGIAGSRVPLGDGAEVACPYPYEARFATCGEGAFPGLYLHITLFYRRFEGAEHGEVRAVVRDRELHALRHPAF